MAKMLGGNVSHHLSTLICRIYPYLIKKHYHSSIRICTLVLVKGKKSPEHRIRQQPRVPASEFSLQY